MISQLFLHVICTSITMSVVLAFILLVWKKAVNRLDIHTWKAVCMVVVICLVVVWKPFGIFELPLNGATRMSAGNDNSMPAENLIPKAEEEVTALQKKETISNADVDMVSINQKDTTEKNITSDEGMATRDNIPNVSGNASGKAEPKKSNLKTDSVEQSSVVTMVLNTIAILWLLVAGIRMIYVWIVYLNFRRKAYHWKEAEIPEHISFILEELLEEYDITFTVGICYSKAVSAPMILGILVPVILLPRLDYTEEEMDFILRHELMHLKKQDILLKLILCFAQTLHWFNPLVHRFCNNMNQYIEICCDYYVLENREVSYRKAYGISIVKLLEETIESKRSVILSTNFNENKESIFRRLKLIMDNTPRKKMRAGMVLLGFVILAVSFLVGIPDLRAKEPGNISADSIIADNQTELQNIAAEEIIEHVGSCEDCYTTDITRGGNHYWIDKNGTLWGAGYSEYGQLGVLKEDLTNITEPCEIAHHVKHVDFSGEYFVIFLTEDNQLYGMGGNPAGILQESGKDDRNSTYMNVITQPVLIMENVIFAKCGYSTIIALLGNGDVYVLGNNDYSPFSNEDYRKPEKVLEDAQYVTSYYQTYAAIKKDGSLWTWGDNRLGQCGAGAFVTVDSPMKVMEDVQCAWMGRIGFNGGDVSAQNNLIVLKKDGSYYGCGEGIGTEQMYDKTDDLDEAHLDEAAKVTASPVFQRIELQKSEMDTSAQNLEKRYENANTLKKDEICDIVKAEIIYEGKVYSSESKELFDWLEEKSSTATEIIGGSGCPFDAAMYITKKNGVVGKIYPATDSCTIFLTGDGYSDFGGTDNSEFWDLFGWNPNEITDVQAKNSLYQTTKLVTKDMELRELKENELEELLLIRQEIFDGLSNEKITEIVEKLAGVHDGLESDIVYYNYGTLTDPDSLGWQSFNDTIPDDNVDSGHWGPEAIQSLEEVKGKLKDERVISLITDAQNEIQRIMDEHSNEAVMKAHMILHDLDYWLFRYPPENFEFAPADWTGINIYYGCLDDMLGIALYKND